MASLEEQSCDFKQLQGLKRRFENNTKFKENDTSFINYMLVQGFAEVVPIEQRRERFGIFPTMEYTTPPTES